MVLRDFLNKPAPQWAQRFAQALPSTRNFAGALENTPKASANFKNPIVRGAANIALDSTVNIPSNLLRSWGKTVGGFTNNSSARQQIGNVGELGLNLASSVPIGKAVSAFKGAMQAPSQRAIANAISGGAKTGFKLGAGYGAGYGATGAMQENQGNLETIKRALAGAGQGALFGGVLGGAIPAAGSFRTTLKNSIQNRTPGRIFNERIPAHLMGGRKIFNAEKPLPEGYVRTGKSNSPVAYEFGGVQPREVPGVYAQRKLAAQEVERGRLSPTLTDWRKGLGEAMPRPGMSIKAVADPLLQEARKYKSAEEFVRAKSGNQGIYNADYEKMIQKNRSEAKPMTQQEWDFLDAETKGDKVKVYRLSTNGEILPGDNVSIHDVSKFINKDGSLNITGAKMGITKLGGNKNVKLIEQWILKKDLYQTPAGTQVYAPDGQKSLSAIWKKAHKK